MTRHLLRDPLELIEKLVVLVLAPRTHLLRYHGVLTPAAAWGSLSVPRPAEGVDQEVRAGMAGARGVPPRDAGR